MNRGQDHAVANFNRNQHPSPKWRSDRARTDREMEWKCSKFKRCPLTLRFKILSFSFLVQAHTNTHSIAPATLFRIVSKSFVSKRHFILHHLSIAFPHNTKRRLWVCNPPGSHDIVQRGRGRHTVEGAGALCAGLGQLDGYGTVRRGAGRDHLRRHTALSVQERVPAGEGKLPQPGLRGAHPDGCRLQAPVGRLQCRVSIVWEKGFACLKLILFLVQLTTIYSPNTPESWRFAHSDLIPAVGIMAFGKHAECACECCALHSTCVLFRPFSPIPTAFMCHHNTFLVYQSMQNATMERWEKVTHFSVGFAWLVAALFGIAGYCTFRALSQGMYWRAVIQPYPTGHHCSYLCL